MAGNSSGPIHISTANLGAPVRTMRGITQHGYGGLCVGRRSVRPRLASQWNFVAQKKTAYKFVLYSELFCTRRTQTRTFQKKHEVHSPTAHHHCGARTKRIVARQDGNTPINPSKKTRQGRRKMEECVYPLPARSWGVGQMPEKATHIPTKQNRRILSRHETKQKSSHTKYNSRGRSTQRTCELRG